MLYRKIESKITEFLQRTDNKILLVSGARQIGKSYIIRYVGKRLFKNFVEIDLIKDFNGNKDFEKANSLESLYLLLGSLYGDSLGNASDTLIFFDEIQQYPHLMTMLKFLRQDNRYRFIASGSLLGVALRKTTSVPIGSIEIMEMYPLDFEEFLIANNVGTDVIDHLRHSFMTRVSPHAVVHQRVMQLYKNYLLVGGLPEAINSFLESRNISKVRAIQKDIHDLYETDASKYDTDHKLNIRKIYNLVPSNMENKKKRIIFKDIEDNKNKRARDYEEDMEYLVSSGITLSVTAISNPKFPLIESEYRNLVKLYLNDVGMLTGILYHNNIQPIINDELSINLGSVYECAVAQELVAAGHKLFYYDNKKAGEVDYLIDDFESLSVAPIEVKSGKDYKRHVALSRFVATDEYQIKSAYVLTNSGNIEINGNIIYLPIYMAMFFDDGRGDREDLILPPIEPFDMKEFK